MTMELGDGIPSRRDVSLSLRMEKKDATVLRRDTVLAQFVTLLVSPKAASTSSYKTIGRFQGRRIENSMRIG